VDEVIDRVKLIAHVSEHAQVWIMDERTKSTGMVREYISPPLTPGIDYTYQVRVRWVEEGKWVEQPLEVRVRAGESHCLEVQPVAGKQGLEEKVKAGLAELSSDDRKLAEAQGFCAVQEANRLGSMGKPVKVMIGDDSVFLCCKGCVEKAKSNRKQTLGKVKELTGKAAKAAPK
jgi:uncharacterized protein (TIGR03000 family)